MPEGRRSGSAWAAGVVGLLASGGYAAAWYWTVERPTCEGTGVFDCSGPALLMYVVGVPAAYVLWSLGLWLVRAPLPWLVPWAVLGALIILVRLTEPIDPPTWVWPVVAALVCAAWARAVPARDDADA